MAQVAPVDFAAVGRVSRFAELQDVRLTEVLAKCEPHAVGALEAQFSHDCAIAAHGNDSLEVATTYQFVGRSAETQVIEIGIKYLLKYSLKASEPLADSDVSQFATSNALLHSWPFVREFLNGLTSRMGFPPFKLGVLHFVPQEPAEKKASEEEPKTPNEPAAAQS